MTISAKFQSKCPTCSQVIRVGEQVEWQRGSKTRHIACVGYVIDTAPRLSRTQRVWRRSELDRQDFNLAAAENLPETVLAVVEMHEDNPAYRNYDLDDYSYDAWVRR